MHVTTLTTTEQLASLADDWDCLAAGIPTRRFAWSAGWWRHYGGGHTLRTLCIRDPQGDVAGIAPWYVRVSPTQGRVIEFLGTGEVCSDYLGLLCATGQESAVAAAIAEHLAEQRGVDRWDLLHLESIDTADSATWRLAQALAERDCTVHRTAGPNCWRLALPADWQTYLASLSKSHRKQVRRFEDRYFDAGRAVLHTVLHPDELAQGRQILIDLHQARRISLGEPGCFASKPFTAFHSDVMERLLAAGALRLHWVELDGQPVAAEYHLAGGGVVYGYQAGVDPNRLDDEPGRLAAIATLKLAIEQGFQAFDFLRGDEPYKAHWRAEPRATFRLRIVPARRSARWRHQAWLARERVKQMVRGLSPAQGPGLTDAPLTPHHSSLTTNS